MSSLNICLFLIYIIPGNNDRQIHHLATIFKCNKNIHTKTARLLAQLPLNYNRPWYFYDIYWALNIFAFVDTIVNRNK